MGFKFNTQHTDDFGLLTKVESLPLLPTKRSESFEVQGRDGNYVFEDGYNNINVEITLYLKESTLKYRRLKARDIAAWLADSGDLILDTEPDIIYQVVKDVNGSSISFSRGYERASVTFECLPYKIQSFDDANLTWETPTPWMDTDIPWDGSDFTKSFVVNHNDTIKVNNRGNYKVLPIVRFKGNCTFINVGPYDFGSTTTGDGSIFVDSEKMIAYGESLENKLNFVDNNFIELEPGVNEFLVQGFLSVETQFGFDDLPIENFEIEFIFKNTYI
jgi:predicted phage tail component-like protein